MKIRFCGAAREVTGSSHLITLSDGFNILLDCGLFQGRGRDIWDKNNNWYFDPGEIDLLILSHAHIDHSGRIPKLVRDGFKGTIVATHATRSLCSIMLMDSAYIQERDVEYYNKKLIKKRIKEKQKDFRVPLYDAEDVEKTMGMFLACAYDQWVPLRSGLDVIFRDAGHILGSASVTLRITEGGKTRTLAFTGDIGRPDRPILRDPRQMPDADFVISESTYGDKMHSAAPAETDRFLKIIEKTCVRHGGKLIIPAFSVGRTQEIIYLLDQLESADRLPDIPVYVDSPLAVNATEIFRVHPECYDLDLHAYLVEDPNPFGWNDLHLVRSVQTSKSLNYSQEPCIIISSSGMMNAGRVRHHLEHNIEDARNTFLIVGYCSPGTPGALLRDGAEAIRVFGDWKRVGANVEVMDSFSAHGDRVEMRDFLLNQRKTCEHLFLVHGEYDTQQDFGGFLKSEGFKGIEIPRPGEVFEL